MTFCKNRHRKYMLCRSDYFRNIFYTLFKNPYLCIIGRTALICHPHRKNVYGRFYKLGRDRNGTHPTKNI